MAYLKPELPDSKLTELTRQIQSISGVEKVRFVSKKEALIQLKEQMKRQASLFDHLAENPLPDAFEIQMNAVNQTWDKVEFIAAESKPSTKFKKLNTGSGGWADTCIFSTCSN